jgi:glycosyltransferase involved in cell wall biosynthesis
MSENKVSILVPVYGVENYIERCAHTLFNQTFTDIEYIFVDDCSKDDSIKKLRSIIALYPERESSISIILHDKNKGVAATRQTAIEAATCAYILFVDSDDYIETDMVELLFKKAVQTSADIVFCPFFFEYQHRKTRIYDQIFSTDKVELINICFKSQAAFWNKMIKRQIIIENDIHILEGINYGEDLSVVPQIIYYSNSFALVSKPLYHYVQYNIDSYTSNFTEKSLTDTLKVTDILQTFFLNKPDYPKYKRILITLMAVRKAKILRSGVIEKQFIELYPEINSRLMFLDLDVKTKIILLLAALNQYRLLKIFVKILLDNNQNNI